MTASNKLSVQYLLNFAITRVLCIYMNDVFKPAGQPNSTKASLLKLNQPL